MKVKNKKISIVDYGMGNLRSVQKAFESFGVKPVITSNKEEILKSDGVILPGVGAFPDAMESLKSLKLKDAVKKAAKEGIPVLGICLGMQLLFEESEEIKTTEGLGLIAGRIKKFEVDLKIPHMGWNNLSIVNDCPLLKDVPNESYVYFVHSYYAEMNRENLAAESLYGIEVPAVVFKDNVYGTQFHPEKSGDVGIQMLKNYWELVK